MDFSQIGKQNNQKHPESSAGSASSETSIIQLAILAESQAELYSASGRYKDAVNSAVKAIELYITARQESRDAAEKILLNKRCAELLARAERWKKGKENTETEMELKKNIPHSMSLPSPTAHNWKRSCPKPTKKITVKETTILLKSSKINGGVFLPWQALPTSKDYPDIPFLDPAGYLKFSESQKGILDGWKRLHELQGGFKILPKEEQQLDLVQDVITDCSIVASLCSAFRREQKGFGQVRFLI